MRIIDTHIHIWDFAKARYSWLEGDTSILNRTYSLAELEEGRKNTNVEYGVLVQAANNFQDTDWMLEVAEKNNWIKGVVGWLPLENPSECKRFLNEKYLKNPYFNGVRHLIHDEKDSRWLLQDKVLESLQILASYDLPFDVVGVLPEHIETVLEVARKVPDLRMVFDHLNQPPIQQNLKYGKWGELMKEASEYSNLYVKISGMGTTSGKPNSWGKSEIKDYIEFIFKHFGIERCFCGGDWPVSLLAGNYSYTWKQYEVTLKEILNEKELEIVTFGNASRFYNLNLNI